MTILIDPRANATRTPQTASFTALGTSAVVATANPFAVARAEAMLRERLAGLDEACSRFRSDAELSAVLRRAGRPTEVSPLLAEYLGVALDIAAATEGVVDPTIGATLIRLGYDRDFALLAACEEPPLPPPARAASWRDVELDRDRRVLRVPPGIVIDLGSSAKAHAADLAAHAIAAATGDGVLVNLGGDVATAGEPPLGGWRIGIAPDCRAQPAECDCVVVINVGGLASSGTAVRTWGRGRRTLHHIIDPATQDAADSPWTLVSVAASSCLWANAWSTATIVRGERGLEQLAASSLPARLVGKDGLVRYLAGWPEDEHAPSAGPDLVA